MDLKSFVIDRNKKFKENSKFLSIKPGESFEGEFVEVSNYEDAKYGNQVSLKFKVNGLIKSFNRPDTGATAKLVNDMIVLGISEQDMVKITRRENDGKASVYKVEKLNETEPIEEDVKPPTKDELEKIFG